MKRYGQTQQKLEVTVLLASTAMYHGAPVWRVWALFHVTSLLKLKRIEGIVRPGTKRLDLGRKGNYISSTVPLNILLQLQTKEITFALPPRSQGVSPFRNVRSVVRMFGFQFRVLALLIRSVEELPGSKSDEIYYVHDWQQGKGVAIGQIGYHQPLRRDRTVCVSTVVCNTSGFSQSRCQNRRRQCSHSRASCGHSRHRWAGCFEVVDNTVRCKHLMTMCLFICASSGVAFGTAPMKT